MRPQHTISQEHQSRDFSSQCGAAPVGHLDELPALERAAIIYLRFWCEGAETRDRIAEDFLCLLDAAKVAETVANFDAIMDCTLGGARRPIMRHGLQCRCFGGDESAFANMVAAAAHRDREDALLFAGLLMSGQAAYAAVQCAEFLGAVFLRIERLSLSAVVPTHLPKYGRPH